MSLNRRNLLKTGGAFAFSSALALSNPISVIAKDIAAQQIEGVRYDSEICSLDELIDAVNKADIAFIGEQHTNSNDKVTLANVLDGYDGRNVLFETGIRENSGYVNKFLEEFNSAVEENKYRVNNLEGVMNRIDNGSINLIPIIAKGSGDSYSEILGSRDSEMAGEINENFKNNWKSIVYVGNDHLLKYSLPGMVDESANVVRVFQAVSPIENDAYAVNASFDRMLDVLGKDEIIFRIGENDYFVVNHSPKERRSYGPLFFEERINRRLEVNNAFCPVDRSYPLVNPVERPSGLNISGEENLFGRVENILERNDEFMPKIEEAKGNVLHCMYNIVNPYDSVVPIKGVFEEYDRLNVLLKERRKYVNELVQKELGNS